MKEGYRLWLIEQGYSDQSVGAWAGCANSVEKLYGDLEGLFVAGDYPGLIEELTYSAEDARRNRPNPSRIQIDGVLRNSLNYYRRGAALYARFLAEAGTGTQIPVAPARPPLRSQC